MLTRLSLACALLCATALPASGQGRPDTQPEMATLDMGRTSVSMRAKATGSMLMPPNSLVIGADVGFLTAQGGVGPEPVRFTDVVFFRPRLRYSLHRRVELFVGTTLLPKQPSFTDELIWQGGHAGLLIGTSQKTALALSGAGGPLMRDPVTGDLGWWTGGAISLQARKMLEEIIVFQGALGGSGGRLLRADTDEPFWLAEIDAHGEVLFQTPRGEFGAWLGVDFHIPVASNPDTPEQAGGPFMDPQNRVNFHMGTVLAFLRGWDLFAQYTILDRGDLGVPATTLPIIEGGFDQRQLMIGINRRYNTRKTNRMFMAR